MLAAALGRESMRAQVEYETLEEDVLKVEPGIFRGL